MTITTTGQKSSGDDRVGVALHAAKAGEKVSFLFGDGPAGTGDPHGWWRGLRTIHNDTGQDEPVIFRGNPGAGRTEG